MPRNPNTPRLARWISRFHLGTPFRSTFSLSFTLSLSLFFQRNPFRGAHQNRLNFELALARLLLSRCHFISTRSTVENVLRTCTIPPSPRYRQLFRIHILSLSLFLLFPLLKFASRRKEFTWFAVEVRKEEEEEFRACIQQLQDKSWCRNWLSKGSVK